MLMDSEQNAYFENFSEEDVADGCSILILPAFFKTDLVAKQEGSDTLERFSAVVDAARAEKSVSSSTVGQVLSRFRTMAVWRAATSSSVAPAPRARSSTSALGFRSGLQRPFDAGAVSFSSKGGSPSHTGTVGAAAHRARNLLGYVTGSMQRLSISVTSPEPTPSLQDTAVISSAAGDMQGSSEPQCATDDAREDAGLDFNDCSASIAGSPLLGTRCVELDGSDVVAAIPDAGHDTAQSGASRDQRVADSPCSAECSSRDPPERAAAMCTEEVAWGTHSPDGLYGTMPAANAPAGVLHGAKDRHACGACNPERGKDNEHDSNGECVARSDWCGVQQHDPAAMQRASASNVEYASGYTDVIEGVQLRAECDSMSAATSAQSSDCTGSVEGSSLDSSPAPISHVRPRDSVRFSIGGSLWHTRAATSSSHCDDRESLDAARRHSGTQASASASTRALGVWARRLPSLKRVVHEPSVPDAAKQCLSEDRPSRIRFSDVEPSAPRRAAGSDGGQQHDRAAYGSVQGRRSTSDSQAFEGEGDAESVRTFVWGVVSGARSGVIAQIWSVFIALTIAFANVLFIVDTHPRFYTPAGADPLTFAFVVDILTTTIFTIEIFLRVWASPSWRALCNVPFAIDVIVVIPAYMELMSGGGGSGPQLSILRIARLLRVLRLFRVSQSSTTLLLSATARSLNVLLMLVLLLSILMTVIASLMHVLERGTWDVQRREWHRELGWHCSYDAQRNADGSFETPAGQHLVGVPPMCSVVDAAHGAEGVKLRCAVSMETGYDCDPSEWDHSPFGSVPASLWWVMVTMFTIGFGDAVPVTLGGRLTGAVVMLVGIMMIALPITVIGYNFSVVYRQANASGRTGKM